MTDRFCVFAAAGSPGAADGMGEPGAGGSVFLASGGRPAAGGAFHGKRAAAGTEPPKKNGGYLFCKRAADLILSLTAILILALPMLVIAIIIKADSKGPVFFRQKRIGRDQKPFYCYKFRTMITEAPKDCPPYMFKNPEDFITKIGWMLRKSSLDELPQLFNIVKGEMSIVGPRPCTPKEVDLIRKRAESGVYALRPGLTGWAQVNGRDEISIKRKVARDREYMYQASVRFDLYILWLTIIKVVRQEGVHEGQNEKNVIR